MRNQLLNKARQEGKYYTYGMPDIESFCKMRSGYNAEKGFEHEDNSTTTIFYKLFMPCCGSHTNYEDKHHDKLLSEIYSPSQEGFILIELMNNYGKWSKKAKELYEKDNTEDIEKEVTREAQQETVTQEEQQETVTQEEQQETPDKIEVATTNKVEYTSRGTLYTNSRFVVSMDGWSEAGMRKYNKLCEMAVNDRNTEKGKEFETLFRNEEKRKRNINRDECVVNEEDYIKPYNNLVDEIDDDSSDDEEVDEIDEDDEDDEYDNFSSTFGRVDKTAV